MSSVVSVGPRVKVFFGGEGSEWRDGGVGRVHIEAGDSSSSSNGSSESGPAHTNHANARRPVLIFVDTEDGQKQFTIGASTEVTTQDETLLLWGEPLLPERTALSFQEPAHLRAIFRQLEHIRYPHDRARSSNSPPLPHSSMSATSPATSPPLHLITSLHDRDDDDETTNLDQDDPRSVEMNADRNFLPPPEMGSLKDLATVFSSPLPPYKRDAICSEIVRLNFLPALLEVFQQCEDLEDMESLHHLFTVFKGIFMLNDNSIYTIMFDEGTIDRVIGVLEHDPFLADPERYREYLTNTVVFKQVVPIKNADVLSKIHITFRLQYIKDVVMARLLDESCFGTINSYIMFNNVDICTALINDPEFVTSLFAIYQADDLPQQQIVDAVLFLDQFCDLAKNLPATGPRTEFYDKLFDAGLMSVLAKFISFDNVAVRRAVMNTYTAIYSHDPSLLHKAIMSDIKICELMPERAAQGNLLKLLSNRVLEDADEGIRLQIVELLRMILDVANLDKTPTEKTAILSDFYEKCIGLLMEPVVRAADNVQDIADPELLVALLELLSVLIPSHTYHVKHYLLGSSPLTQVMKMMKAPHKFLVLAALRCFRVVVGMKDDFLNRYILKHDFFHTIIDVFEANGSKYNLLNSAIIELFDFIRDQNIKPLIQHIIVNFESRICNVSYVDTFMQLKRKHEINTEPFDETLRDTQSDSNEPANVTRKRRRDVSNMDEEEEAYFDTDDDEASNASLGSTNNRVSNVALASLSQYDDDEFDSRRPVRRHLSPEE